MVRLLLALVLAVAATVAQSLPARASVAPSPSSYRCGWCPRRSTASLLPPDAGVLTGAACGYGDPADLAADGGFHIAAVGAGFFRGGRACGACYQLRWRDRSACVEGGVKVVVVDVSGANTNRTAGSVGGGRFLLSKDAFAALTTTRDDSQLASLVDTAVDVDFRRIQCMYNSKNLAVRVEETSNRDNGHLALRFLYQSGQTDIVAVDVAQAAVPGAAQSSVAPSPTNWQYMTRREGSPGVWRTSRAPAGPLQLRLVVTAGSGGKWLRADGAVLPAEWQPGAVYDTGLHVTDVAARTCSCASASGDDDEEE